ncbi:hypothetical protein EJ06DRAFT_187927 [Trichodelitschia bisporula]|uniref:Uncharacterized protein n=1 Tax=Trichodelitschia bisporula TaxID=703511 RepID=A0A6G1I708_9PEZI|nr:hypothetical protein EJ06DRAFT_187927 [Trichodelitschia bisporula]
MVFFQFGFLFGLLLSLCLRFGFFFLIIPWRFNSTGMAAMLRYLDSGSDGRVQQVGTLDMALGGFGLLTVPCPERRRIPLTKG